MNPTCETCRFFHLVYPSTRVALETWDETGRALALGECRRRCHYEDRGLADWCGEHEPIGTTTLAERIGP